MRVRMAFEMLQHGDLSSLMWGLAPTEGTGKSDLEVAEERGKMAARAALAASSELIRMAEAGGLVKPLPESGLSTGMRRHAVRTVAWQTAQYVEGQRAQREMGGLIATPAGTPAPILPASGGGQPN